MDFGSYLDPVSCSMGQKMTYWEEAAEVVEAAEAAEDLNVII